MLTLLPAGNGSFSNYHMVGAVLAVPYVLWKFLPIPYFSFTTVYTLLLLLTGLPVIVGYWMVMSHIGPRKRSNVILPGKNIEEYLDIKDPALKARYFGQKKIPMQIFHDAYFEDKIEVKGASSRPCPERDELTRARQATCSRLWSSVTTGLRTS